MLAQAQHILVGIGLEEPYTCHARSAIVVWWILFVPLEAVWICCVVDPIRLSYFVPSSSLTN